MFRSTYFNLKKAFRPAVVYLRDLVDQLAAKSHPKVEWNGEHHPAIKTITPWEGEATGEYFYDFLGVKTHQKFRSSYHAEPKGKIKTEYPTPSQNYFELIGILSGVLDAEGPEFSMIELGAGYGHWSVKVAKAIKQKSNMPVRLVSVEMEPTRFKWMKEHYRNNGLDPNEHTLIHSAVSDHENDTLYFVEGVSEHNYGLSLLRAPGLRSKEIKNDNLSNKDSNIKKSHADSNMRIPCVRLKNLMQNFDMVDIIHMDVQGEELVVIRDSIDVLKKKTKRLLIGTHSRLLHNRIGSLLRAENWRIIFDFAPKGTRRTDFGDIYFLDGLLVCENQSFIP